MSKQEFNLKYLGKPTTLKGKGSPKVKVKNNVSKQFVLDEDGKIMTDFDGNPLKLGFEKDRIKKLNRKKRELGIFYLGKPSGSS